MFFISNLVSVPVKMGVRSRFPVEGASLILGNYLSGAKVFPHPIVAKRFVMRSLAVDSLQYFQHVLSLVHRHATMRMQLICMSPFLLLEILPPKLRFSVFSSVGNTDNEILEKESSLTMGGKQLCRAQKSDPSLTRCVEAMENKREGGSADGVWFFWDQGVLKHEWLSLYAKEAGLSPEYQIVLPAGYRKAVLRLSHDHPVWSFR